MRFPKLSDLDRDQTEIYQGAPTDGTILIIGPPGTGKTVIAFHRAHVLSQLERRPRVIMYNKVLAKFTGTRGDVAAKVRVSTFYQWASNWWKTLARTRGNPPYLGADSYDYDWGAMQSTAVQAAMNSDTLQRVHWGHLVIDEGQDFPARMYVALKCVMDVANACGAKPAFGLTVLADENQRLKQESNSSLEEIRKGLGLHEDDKTVFCLKKNYRNTKEIASFTRNFYVGIKSGVPDLPDRSGGDLPTVSVVSADTHKKFLTKCADKIARYAMSRRTDEVGVLVRTTTDREKLFNRLQARLDGSEVGLQSYGSGDKVHTAEALEFDVPGHVTVLNFASAKGLEFDSVFVVDPGSLLSSGSSELSTKMNLYVMCSRARSSLNLMLSDDEKSRLIIDWVPRDLFELEEL